MTDICAADPLPPSTYLHCIIRTVNACHAPRNTPASAWWDAWMRIPRPLERHQYTTQWWADNRATTVIPLEKMKMLITPLAKPMTTRNNGILRRTYQKGETTTDHRNAGCVVSGWGESVGASYMTTMSTITTRVKWSRKGSDASKTNTHPPYCQ